MQTALTIAGSDSSGGAGLQADLVTFAAHGVYGMSAVTAVTAQSTRGVGTVLPLPPSLVREQIDAVVTDLGADATKIGMLATGAIARVVADAITRHALRHVVLDTVLRSTSGAARVDEDGVGVLRDALISAAEVVTANVPEAEALTGIHIQSVADSRRAARALVTLGARLVVVKGGHLEGAPIDVVDDGRETIELGGERLPGRHTHGTGCTFASAIAARLARGESPLDAIRAAKSYVARAIAAAPGLGGGRGPLGRVPVDAGRDGLRSE
jgi:hydroxymethylpyrimidine/phosphomethylpyrimidine kinase